MGSPFILLLSSYYLVLPSVLFQTALSHLGGWGSVFLLSANVRKLRILVFSQVRRSICENQEG